MLHIGKRPSHVLIFVLLAALLTGCPAPTPTPAPIEPTQLVPPVPEPTNASTPAPSPTTDPIAGIRVDCEEFAAKGIDLQQRQVDGMKLPPFAGLIYVEGQLLIGGVQNDIATIIDELELSLERLGEPILLQKGESIQLYASDSKVSVEQTTCMINRLAKEQGLIAYADPNYFTSPAGWHGGGSPWTQNGVWAQNGGGLGTAPSTQFLSQWAFGDRGIELFGALDRRLTKQLGTGAIIGIFDTAPPFKPVPLETNPSLSSCAECDLGRYFPTPRVGRAPSTSPMIIQDLQPQNSPTCPGANRVDGEPLEDQDLSSHGLFVAGLAQIVAPSSQIYLVRVLADDACGDLDTILRGLNWFETQMASNPQGLTGVVVNLSLGLHHPDEARDLGLPDEVITLQKKVAELVEQGAIVVAASGNDSFLAYPAADPPEIPASEKGVIAVAGSTNIQTRGCYSNSGMVAAPGGQGVIDEKAAVKCTVPGETSPGRWTCQSSPDLCVVSLVRDPIDGKVGYSYWVGTSFATPMVSGLAALLVGSGLSPAEVRNTLIKEVSPVPPGESMGSGIVNIEQATSVTPIP